MVACGFNPSRACKDPAAKAALQMQLEELQAQAASMKNGPSKDKAALCVWDCCHMSKFVYYYCTFVQISIELVRWWPLQPQS